VEKGIEIGHVGHQRKISRLRFELRATSTRARGSLVALRL
jgi:hypothetical protein